MDEDYGHPAHCDRPSNLDQRVQFRIPAPLDERPGLVKILNAAGQFVRWHDPFARLHQEPTKKEKKSKAIGHITAPALYAHAAPSRSE